MHRNAQNFQSELEIVMRRSIFICTITLTSLLPAGVHLGNTSQVISLPIRPKPKFLHRPVTDVELQRGVAAISCFQVRLSIFDPPDLIELRGGAEEIVELRRDGKAKLTRKRASSGNGSFAADLDVLDFAKLCILLDAMQNGTPKENIGRGAVRDSTVCKVEVWRKGIGADRERRREYVGEPNFGDYRMWLLVRTIQGIASRMEWKEMGQ